MIYNCCEGIRPAKFSRRFFLKQGGIALAGLSTMPAFLQRAIASTPSAGKKQFVVLFQPLLMRRVRQDHLHQPRILADRFGQSVRAR